MNTDEPSARPGASTGGKSVTLLDHVVLQVDDLNAIGDWYDQVVGLLGGTRVFDTPNVIGYALPGQPAQLFFSRAAGPGGRQTHLALRAEDEATVRRATGGPLQSVPKSSTSHACGRSTRRTTTRCSSATRPETTSNSSVAPRRHG